MKIEDLVLSIDQMLHLKELGVEVKDTAFSWGEVYENVFGVKLLKPCRKILMNPVVVPPLKGWRAIPTLTLQEIFEMLPPKIEVGPNHSKYLLEVYTDSHLIRYATGSGRELRGEFFHGSLLVAAYGMLCWVAENGYLNKE